MRKNLIMELLASAGLIMIIILIFFRLTDRTASVVSSKGSMPSCAYIASESLRSVPGFTETCGFKSLPLEEGGYMILGNTNRGRHGGYDVFLLRTDRSGRLLWLKEYGTADGDIGRDLIRAKDKGFAICGYTFLSGTGSQAILIRTDKDGELLWQRTYGGTDDDYAYSLCEKKDSGFVLAGRSLIKQNFALYVISTDKSGNALLDSRYSEMTAGRAAAITENGSVLIAGEIKKFSGESDVCALMLGADGKKQWFSAYPLTGIETAASVTYDGSGFDIYGESESTEASELLLIRIKKDGTLISKETGRYASQKIRW